MNLLLLEPADLVSGSPRARINGRRFRHMREIHRVGCGDSVRVGLIGGRLGRGTVVSLDSEAIELELVLEDAPPAPLPVTVLLALPRPKVLCRVIQGLAAIGVKRIYLMNSWRVDKSYWQSPKLRPGALRTDLILGLEQACDTQLPTVELRMRFKPFVQDEVPRLMRGTIALIADPDGARACPRVIGQPVTLAVGPEGGFIQYELDLLSEIGFEAVSLGPRRLRVEQAIPALLGRLY